MVLERNALKSSPSKLRTRATTRRQCQSVTVQLPCYRTMLTLIIPSIICGINLANSIFKILTICHVIITPLSVQWQHALCCLAFKHQSETARPTRGDTAARSSDHLWQWTGYRDSCHDTWYSTTCRQMRQTWDSWALPCMPLCLISAITLFAQSVVRELCRVIHSHVAQPQELSIPVPKEKPFYYMPRKIFSEHLKFTFIVLTFCVYAYWQYILSLYVILSSHPAATCVGSPTR